MEQTENDGYETRGIVISSDKITTMEPSMGKLMTDGVKTLVDVAKGSWSHTYFIKETIDEIMAMIEKEAPCSTVN